MSDQSRNLNAHAAAHAAAAIWGAEYANQGGGLMDFWDQLTPAKKRIAADCARRIRQARPYTGRP